LKEAKGGFVKKIYLLLSVISIVLCFPACGDGDLSSIDPSADESTIGSGSLSLAPSDFSQGVAGEVELPRSDE